MVTKQQQQVISLLLLLLHLQLQFLPRLCSWFYLRKFICRKYVLLLQEFDCTHHWCLLWFDLSMLLFCSYSPSFHHSYSSFVFCLPSSFPPSSPQSLPNVYSLYLSLLFSSLLPSLLLEISPLTSKQCKHIVRTHVILCII